LGYDEETKSDITLSYFEQTESGEEGALKGKIDLREFLSFSFSPKTTVKGVEIARSFTVFKMLLTNGRRYVLAAPHETTLRWGAALTWYACAGRLINEWRVNFGDLSRDNITLRDWLNACVVRFIFLI
jgi:hypothetical protein